MIDDHLELDVPEAVAATKQAIEIVRGWIGDGALHVALNANAFGDSHAEWGRALGQMAHHIARAAALAGQTTHHEALQAIRAGFEATLPERQPTMSGEFLGRTRH